MKMTKTQENFVRVLASLRKELNLAEEDIVGTVVMCCTEEAMIRMVDFMKEEYEKGTLTRDKLVAKVHDIVQTC